MKKSIGVLAVVCLVVISFFLIGICAFGTQGTYYGFISCSDRETLHYMHEVLLFEFIVLLFSILLGISQVFFLSYSRIKGILPYITVVMAVNLIAISYKVLEYPVILRRDGRFTALEEGAMRNPLFVLSFLHAIALVGWINLFLKSLISTKQRLLMNLVILLLILTGIIVFILNKPVPCFG